MKISIAVPSYNYAVYLHSCLNSILAQTYQSFEVLVADGGSSDNSLEVIKAFTDKDHRFKLVSQQDNGQSDAIMKCFKQASGDIFCYLNADDIFISNDTFLYVVNSFSEYEKIDVISMKGYYISKEGRLLKEINHRYHPFDSTANMRNRTAVLQPATFWRKEVSVEIPFDINNHYSFDAVFFYKCYEKFQWLDLPKIVAGHRLHGENKANPLNLKRVKELIEFERMKFGKYSYRVFYLAMIWVLMTIFDKIPYLGKRIKRIVYLGVNSLSFLTFYRLPSI